IGAYESAMTSPVGDTARISNNVNVAARVLSWEIAEPESEQSNMLTTLGSVVFKISVQVNVPIANGTHGIALKNRDGQIMWGWAKYNLNLDVGCHDLRYVLPS